MRIPFDLSSDRLLQFCGLQRQRSAASIVLPAMGMFGIGLLAGAGLGLLFAPRKGSEMRHELGSRLSDVTHRVGDAAGTVARKLRRTTRDIGDEVSNAIDEARGSIYGGSNGVG